MPSFKPPDNFTFDKPGEWLSWRQRFVRYRTATKLTEEDGTVQVSTLIYTMGNEAENIYKSFVFNDRESRDDFDTVLKKFDDYFVPQTNIIHERASYTVSPANSKTRGKSRDIYPCTVVGKL